MGGEWRSRTRSSRTPRDARFSSAARRRTCLAACQLAASSEGPRRGSSATRPVGRRSTPQQQTSLHRNEFRSLLLLLLTAPSTTAMYTLSVHDELSYFAFL